MPKACPPADEAEVLWEKFLSGKLEDASANRLLAWFESHPDDLRSRQREAAVSSSLECLLGPEAASRRLVKSVQARVEGTAAGKSSGRFQQSVMESLKRPSVRARTLRRRTAEKSSGFWLPAAAAAMVLLGLLYYFNANQPQPPVTENSPPPPKPVAPPVVVEAAGPTLRVRSGNASVDARQVSGAAAIRLNPDSRIALASGSSADLVMSDGTLLRLAENSKLQILEAKNGEHVRLTHGSANVRAAKQVDGKQFVIETAHANVRVVGTEYLVQAYERCSRVAVTSGKVSVAPTAGTPPQFVNGGEEIVADANGLESVRVSSNRRVLAAGLSGPEEFSDAGVLSDVPGERFGDMAMRRMSYPRPVKGRGYCGIHFPVTLLPAEDTFEVWIRPRWVALEKEEYRMMKVAMLAQLGSTEYRIGAVEIFPVDRDWVVLRGKLAGATLHWVEPGTKQLALKSELIQHLALRTEIGNIEFDHTGIIVWNSAAKK